jgi:hypothetical protein
MVPCVPKLLAIERREIRRKARDHVRSAPAPCGTLSGLFLSRPSHLRIFFAQLRVTCIEASLSAALGAMATAVRAEERSRSPDGTCRLERPCGPDPVSQRLAERSTVTVLAQRRRIRLPARNPPTRNAREARS